MTDLILMIFIIGMPVASLIYTVAKDKKEGANGW